MNIPEYDWRSAEIGLHKDEIEPAKRVLHGIKQVPDYPWDIPFLDYTNNTLTFFHMNQEACINFLGMLGKFIELGTIDKASLVGILAKSGTAIEYVKNHRH